MKYQKKRKRKLRKPKIVAKDNEDLLELAKNVYQTQTNKTTLIEQVK